MTEISTSVSIVASMAPGAIGGFCNVCVGHPMDLIKVRQQMMTINITGNGGITASSQHTTIGYMIRSIVQSNGVTGLYAGVSAPLVAVVPAFAITFASYEYATNRIQQRRQQQPNQSSLSLSHVAMAGAFSGIPNALVVGPTERIKCLMQMNPNDSHYRTFGKSVRTVYSTGGISGLFRGTMMTVLRDVPGNAAYFATYEYLKRQFRQLYADHDEYHNQASASTVMIASTVLAGGLAGMANWVVAIPFDVVKSRWQSSEPGRYRNIPAVVHHLFQTEGPKAFFRGLTPALLRAFPANAACFLGAETAKRFLVDR